MFYDIFCALCAQKGVRPSRAADAIGFSRATVTNWKKNGYSPRQESIRKIADYFGVPASALIEGSVGSSASENDPMPEESIEGILEEAARRLKAAQGLTCCGLPASDKAVKNVCTVLEAALALAKENMKEED